MSDSLSSFVFADSNLAPSIGEDFLLPFSSNDAIEASYATSVDEYCINAILQLLGFGDLSSAAHDDKIILPSRDSPNWARRRPSWTVKGVEFMLETIIEEI